MALCTGMLDGLHAVPMTPGLYLRAVVPTGLVFTVGLVCANVAYMHISVAFIQMLKATTPMAVLLCGRLLGVATPTSQQLLHVSVIVFGVALASLGEADFVLLGFAAQLAAILCEALRMTMTQRLLGGEHKMDPLVSLYYFAPVGAVAAALAALHSEVPQVTMNEVRHVGVFVFFLNGLWTFLLSVSLVLLIGRTSAVVLTVSGVFKDVLLIMASILFFGTHITMLQFLGYAVLLAGTVYYKLGYEQAKAQVAEAGRQWRVLGAERPVLRRVCAIAMGVFMMWVFIGNLRSGRR